MTQHPWWYLARGFGLVAWLTLCVSMLAGVALAHRRARSAPAILDIHRFLGLIAILLTAVHATALVADGFVGYGTQQVLLPFRSAWRPGPVTWGILAAYLLVVVEGSSLLGRHMSRTRWRRLHTLSYPCFAAASIHFASAGSDVARWVPQWVSITLVGAIIAGSVWGAARAERAAERNTPMSW